MLLTMASICAAAFMGCPTSGAAIDMEGRYESVAGGAGGELVRGASPSGRKAEKRCVVGAAGGGVRVGEADDVDVVEVVGGGGDSVSVVVAEREADLSA